MWKAAVLKSWAARSAVASHGAVKFEAAWPDRTESQGGIVSLCLSELAELCLCLTWLFRVGVEPDRD